MRRNLIDAGQRDDFAHLGFEPYNESKNFLILVRNFSEEAFHKYLRKIKNGQDYRNLKF